mgnify:CR=1 FL=1
MFIKSLKLKHYRNYESLNIQFAKNFNIIYGDNGQGKTNILETIFLCASGRSHRTSKDHDLIKLNKDEFYIKLDMEKEGIDSSIEINLKKNDKKKIKINEIPIKKVGNLMGHLNAVIFSPEDLMIIKEGPSERRRFIDITISQLKPSYFYDLQQYAKILFQRNALLKEIQSNRSLMNTLDIWNENLVKVGSRIIKVRKDFIQRISKEAHLNHSKLTNSTEDLKLTYSPSINFGEKNEISEIEKAFIKKIEISISKELMKCITLNGPHRDDYELFLNNTSLKLFGSQGQQRTSILSIKLSEISIMKEETGEYPVLLLDDVMSELDNKRQEYLMNNLDKIQTFITSTDMSFFKEKVTIDSKTFRIYSGEVLVN